MAGGLAALGAQQQPPSAPNGQMSIGDIIRVAAPRQAPGIPLEHVFAKIAQELNAEGTIAMQFGNTLFIAHRTKRPDMAIFRALNADNPRAYIDNVLRFFEAMLRHGIRILITEFKDPSIINIAKAIQFKLGNTNALQYAVQRTVNGGFRMTILIGDEFINDVG